MCKGRHFPPLKEPIAAADVDPARLLGVEKAH